MITKGAARCNGGQLGTYLGSYLFAEKNDRVEMIELRGSAHRGLTDSLASWEAEAAGTRCKKALWHAQMRTPSHEHLTREQQILAADVLEKHLGLQGQPRAIVIHENDGHQHIHIVWSRIDRETGKARRDSFSKKNNVAASREIEERFGLQKVASPTFKNDDKTNSRQERREESKKSNGKKDYSKSKRTGFDPAERKKTITALWHDSDSGKAFRAALQDAGYILARGDSRTYVVVDKAGEIHSLARQIQTKGVLKEHVDARLADLDPASIPKATHIQQQLRQAWREKEFERRTQAHERDGGKQADNSKKAAPDPPKPASKLRDTELDHDSLDPSTILAGITQGKSTFTKSDLHYEITQRLKKTGEEFEAREVGRIAKAVGELKDFVTLGEDRVGRPRYTSRDMLETELAMRDSSDVLAGRKVHGVFHKVRDAAPSAGMLGMEQRQAFEHVTGADGFAAVTGYAGSGKSTMLRAANEAWVASGKRVIGVALSGMAAQSLQQGSDIESRTLASLFMAMDKLPQQQAKLDAWDGRIGQMSAQTFDERKRKAEQKMQRDMFASQIGRARFTERDVIVLDEAAMVGSRQMQRLLAEAEKAKAKVVLVGDAEQLQAIDAGGSFRHLTERHGSVKISEIRRQKDDWAKQATKDFGDGYTAEALNVYRDKSHIHEVADHAQVRERIVADWTASRQANPKDTHLMLAFTRDDVAKLNEAAREAYKKEGRLGISEAVHTDAGHQDFARGDRLYFLQNDARLKVKNGSLGTVEKIERFQMQNYHRMTVKLDSGDTVQFPTADYNKFAHGYSGTIHKAQGATANRAHILASQYMDRHAAYVAMTRHTDRADMYYTKAEFKDFDSFTWSLSRDRRKDTTLDYLGRAERDGTAAKFWERVHGKVVEITQILTVEQKRKEVTERLLEALRINKDPELRKKAMQERQAEIAAKKLREILDDHPDKRKRRSAGLSM